MRESLRLNLGIVRIFPYLMLLKTMRYVGVVSPAAGRLLADGVGVTARAQRARRWLAEGLELPRRGS
jgi:hypothetical protein